MSEARADDGGGPIGPPAVVVDVLLAVGVALALAVVVAMAQGSARPPAPSAYLFAAAFGAVMLLRRRWPLVVLALTVVGVLGYHALDHPPLGVAVPLAAALYAAADAGRVGWAVTAGVVVLGVSMAVRLGEGEAAALLFGYEAVTNSALIAAAVALGDGVRARRVLAERHAEVLRLSGAQARREAEARVLAERERVSRDLHDSLGHTMSVVALQTGVAQQAVDADERGRARDALTHVRTANSRALADLRTVVRVLRDPDEAAGEAVPSLASVGDLVSGAEAAGLRIVTSIEVPDDLPAPVEAAAFRIVQEALTNVVRHAGAREVELSIGPTGDGGVAVTVTDDGQRLLEAPRSGHGLRGMAERARLLGGRLSAEPVAGGGFAVRAVLPAATPTP